MKKFYVGTLLFLLLSVAANAQIQQGTITIGGSFSINSQKNSQEFLGANPTKSDVDRNSFSINPRVGYFATSTLVVGLGLTYDRVAFERTHGGTSDPTSVTNELLINPYVEKYFSISEKLYATTAFNILFGTGKIKQGEFESDITSFRVNLMPGLTYFVSDKFAITGNFGQLFYNSRKIKNKTTTNQIESENTDSQFGLNVSLNSFSLGIRYFIGNMSE